MNFPVVFLQPRANAPTQPSWPTDSSPSSLEEDAGGPADASPTPVQTPVTDGNPWAGTATQQEGGYLTQESCQAANQMGLIAAGGYVFSAVLLGVVTFTILRRKLWGSSFSRYGVGIGTAAILAALLVAFDPAQGDALTMCRNSADFARYIFLGTANLARAFVLGLAPATIAAWAGCYAVNRT